MVRIESVVRKEGQSSVEDVIDLFVDLLSSRTNLIVSSSKIPSELTEAIHTIVWASSRLKFDELDDVRAQLLLKYGPSAHGANVNSEVKSKLESGVPHAELKLAALEGIAAEFGVRFQ
jgi:hypothetical protein